MDDKEVGAHIEILSGIARVFADGSSYGDPFAWSATIHWLDPETVEVKAALRAPTMPERRKLIMALKQLGVKYMVISRIKNGNKVVRKHSLERMEE